VSRTKGRALAAGASGSNENNLLGCGVRILAAFRYAPNL
jgi:hypothetical protein